MTVPDELAARMPLACVPLLIYVSSIIIECNGESADGWQHACRCMLCHLAVCPAADVHFVQILTDLLCFIAPFALYPKVSAFLTYLPTLLTS